MYAYMNLPVRKRRYQKQKKTQLTYTSAYTNGKKCKKKVQKMTLGEREIHIQKHHQQQIVARSKASAPKKLLRWK